MILQYNNNRILNLFDYHALNHMTVKYQHVSNNIILQTFQKNAFEQFEEYMLVYKLTKDEEELVKK